MDNVEENDLLLSPEHEQHEQPDQGVQQQLQQQQLLLEHEFVQLQQQHDIRLAQVGVAGEHQIHHVQEQELHESMRLLLQHVQRVHQHMRLQQHLLQLPRPGAEPSFRIHIYQTTSMILSHVSTTYVVMIGIMVALSIFDQHWTIILVSTSLLLLSAVVCYGMLSYYYRVNEDPAVQNRYLRVLRAGSYLAAIASAALLVGDVLLTGYSVIVFWVIVSFVCLVCLVLSWWFY